MNLSERKRIIREYSEESLLDAFPEELLGYLPSKIWCHVPSGCNAEEMGAELKERILKAVESLVEEAEENINEGNHIECEFVCNYETDGQDIYLHFGHASFEEFGHNVQPGAELFADLDMVVFDTINEYAIEKDIDKDCEYAGILAWSIYDNEAENMFSVMGNSKKTKTYAKKVIAECDELWDVFEEEYGDELEDY